MASVPANMSMMPSERRRASDFSEAGKIGEESRCSKTDRWSVPASIACLSLLLTSRIASWTVRAKSRIFLMAGGLKYFPTEAGSNLMASKST